MSKVFDKLISDCQKAYQSKYPLIFIKTEEQEIIRRLIYSDSLVVRLMNKPGTEIGDMSYIPCKENCIPYVRYSDNDSGAIVNVFLENKTVGEIRFPIMRVLHMSADKSNHGDNYAESIMEFVDRYERSSEDNGALRSSLYLLYGDPSCLTPEMYDYCSIIDVDLPDSEEISDTIIAKLNQYPSELKPPEYLQSLAYHLCGFSVIQVERIIDAILSAPEIDGFNAIYDEARTKKLIRERKEQLLKREEILELKNPDAELEIGGMQGFSEWFERQQKCLLESDRMQREMGIFAPKGLLMCGVPGCGKSMAAKSVAAKLKIPLLQMDIGKLMGRYVGDSEKNMDKALKLAEAMSPCVLWIDELDKGFSNAGKTGNSGDSGVFKRMFGMLLTWMQERTKPCFIFATANDITEMPKEFFRSGRFDALFAVYMPTSDECVKILKNQMEMVSARVRKNQKRELFDSGCFNTNFLEEIVKAFCFKVGEKDSARFVTGADIEKLVSMALRNIWINNSECGIIHQIEWKDTLLDVLKNTTVYGDGIENLDSLAMCYLRLIRNNFQPAAGEENTLFSPQDYKVEYDEKGNVKAAGFIENTDKTKNMTSYDRILYSTLREHINGLAVMYEQNNRYKIVR